MLARNLHVAYKLSRLVKLLIVTALVFGGLFISWPKPVEAMLVNPSNLPQHMRGHTDPDRSRCQTSHGVFKASQNHWISTRNDPTNISPVTIPFGQDRVRLRWNVLGHHCTHNMIPVDNDDPWTTNPPNHGLESGVLDNRRIQITRSHVIDASTSHGSIGGIGSGDHLDTQWRNSYVHNSPTVADHFYVKQSSNPNDVPEFQLFDINGLSNLPPGNHEITVILRVKMVNWWSDNPGNDVYGCVDNFPFQPTSGINDHGPCNAVNTGAKVRVKVQNPLYDLRAHLNPVGGWTGTGLEPGDQRNLIATIRNHGSDPGPDARLRLQITRGGQHVSNVRIVNQGGATLRSFGFTRNGSGCRSPDPPGPRCPGWWWRFRSGALEQAGASGRDDRHQATVTFRINQNTPDNTRVCFRAFATPRRHDIIEHRSTQFCTLVRVPREPYLSTSGGDVHAGYEYGSEPCLLPTDSLARIRGNVRSGFGSKADFVVSAGGQIRQFGSVGSPSNDDLTLGNTGQDGFYGQVCRPDQFHKLWDHPDVVTATSVNAVRNLLVSSGADNLIINFDGNLTLRGPIQIPKGKHVTLVVNGSVHITRGGAGAGITLHPGPYTESGRSPAIQDVPSFALVTSDDIRIDNRITRLDGIYYAGTTGNTGTIDTCGNSATGSGPRITGSGEAANCNRRLTVRGALVSDVIRFRRTFGDVRFDRTAPAEEISFLAQLYLQPPPGFNLLVAQLLYNGERPPTF